MSNKKNKKSLVPERRFPGFKGEWEVPTLGDISERVTEKVGDRAFQTVSISAGIGFVSQAEKFSRDISGEQYKNYTVLKKGEFSYNKGNSKRFPQGCVYKLKEFDKVAAPNVFISFQFKKGYVGDFFQGYFESNFHGEQLKEHITSGARSNGLLNISADAFFSIKLPTPTDVREQQKIADCLSSLDEIITAQGKKLEALQDHKKALMQSLLPREGQLIPVFRFPKFKNTGKWQLVPIGEKIDLLSGYPFDGADISENSEGIKLLRGINITEGRIRHTEDIDRYYLKDVTPLEKYRVQVNDLVIGMDGSKVGKNAALIASEDAGALLVQRVARLRARSEVLIRFIYQHIRSEKFHAYVDKINTSSGIPHISAKQIKEFEICFPELDEQNEIVDCLTSVDDAITGHLQKLETLEEHKRGLMQQLFPALEKVEEG